MQLAIFLNANNFFLSVSSEERENGQCEIMAPITSPSKVACVGLNYRDHCEETGKPVPLEPIFFSKLPSCVIGPFDGIPNPTGLTKVNLIFRLKYQ